MNSFLAGQNIEVSFDLSLAGLEVSSLAYRVADQDGVELVARTNTSYTPGDQTKVIQVAAIHNQLPVGDVSAARVVYLYVTGTGGAAGEVRLSESYRLTAEDTLPIPEASFQTLASADMIGVDLVGVADFTGASENDRIAALRQARDNLCQLNYRFEVDKSRASYGVGGHLFNDGGFDLSEMSLTEFTALPADFRAALKRAQVLEAAFVLQASNSEIAQLRADGLVSITVGESSRTYTRNKTARSAVSARAARVLSNWLSPIRIGRA